MTVAIGIAVDDAVPTAATTRLSTDLFSLADHGRSGSAGTSSCGGVGGLTTLEPVARESVVAIGVEHARHPPGIVSATDRLDSRAASDEENEGRSRTPPLYGIPPAYSHHPGRTEATPAHQSSVMPPSTTYSLPVTKLASAESRKLATDATSSG